MLVSHRTAIYFEQRTKALGLQPIETRAILGRAKEFARARRKEEPNILGRRALEKAIDEYLADGRPLLPKALRKAKP